MAYALAAQADTQVFAGVLTTGFCPDHSHQRMVCGDGVKRDRLQPAELNFPWLSAAGDNGCRAGQASRFVQQVAMAREFKRTARGDASPGLGGGAGDWRAGWRQPGTAACCTEGPAGGGNASGHQRRYAGGVRLR